MGLLGSRVFADPDPDEPRVLDIQGSDAERAFDALGSETARGILKAIYEQPRTPPEIRGVVGTSLQNVHYHLDRLEGADLIEPAGTGYSEKGNEMTVYAPCNEALVLFAGTDHDRSRFERLLGRVLSLYLLLGTLTIGLALFLRDTAQGGAEVFTMSADTGESAAQAADGVARTTDPALVGLSLTDPAVAFFLGGLVVIAGLAAVWWVRG
ncbi:ArsR/SmtB family transcription factor [Halosegnis marinus]|uniref:ArsR/SmtB family transcription factor n=1 Tax=Halosegnis marinus TaxID=3034023 RepID=A0ABD5ZK70_9EURY|nr:helix-turn-helix domain-containing protein [Halosegnis sp. DT85]